MSPPPISFENSATAEYLAVVRLHVISPLQTGSVSESCFAAALLVFGAIDGLGKLLHPSKQAGAGDRFRCFLRRLGPNYAEMENEIWKLRNSLSHNALNVACFMAKTEDAFGEHLEREGEFVFVHTRRLLEDFNAAVEVFETDVRFNPDLFHQTESRLAWSEITPFGWRGDGVKTTMPVGIYFVTER